MGVLVLMLLFLGMIIFCNCWVEIKREKKDFENRITMLEAQLRQKTQKNSHFENQILLCTMLMEQIKASNAFLNEAIFDLNSNLFGELYPKKDLH